MSGFPKNLGCTSGGTTEAYELFFKEWVHLFCLYGGSEGLAIFWTDYYIPITGQSLKNGDSLDMYFPLPFIPKLPKLRGICYYFFTYTDVTVHFAMKLSILSCLLTTKR